MLLKATRARPAAMPRNALRRTTCARRYVFDERERVVDLLPVAERHHVRSQLRRARRPAAHCIVERAERRADAHARGACSSRPSQRTAESVSNHVARGAGLLHAVVTHAARRERYRRVTAAFTKFASLPTLTWRSISPTPRVALRRAARAAGRTRRFATRSVATNSNLDARRGSPRPGGDADRRAVGREGIVQQREARVVVRRGAGSGAAPKRSAEGGRLEAVPAIDLALTYAACQRRCSRIPAQRCRRQTARREHAIDEHVARVTRQWPAADRPPSPRRAR